MNLRVCLSFLIISFLSNSIPCSCLIYFRSADQGRRLCPETFVNLGSCRKAGYKEWTPLLFPQKNTTMTLPRIKIFARTGSCFTVRLQNGNTIHNVFEFFMTNARTGADIELQNTSSNYVITCASYGSFSKVSSNIVKAFKTASRVRYSIFGGPTVHKFTDVSILDEELISGHFTCSSVNDPNNAETFNIFTQPTASTDTDPFVPAPNSTILNDKSVNFFLVPCRTNRRMESPPDLLKQSHSGTSDFIKLNPEDMKIFSWNPSVGFKFSIQDTDWATTTLACQSGSFKRIFPPAPSRFKQSVFVEAQGNLIGCVTRERSDVPDLVNADYIFWKGRVHPCDTYIDCGLKLESGKIFDEENKQFDILGIGMVPLTDKFGIFHCFLNHTYQGKKVTEKSSKMFFVGFDSNMYLLPGSYPNTAVIQIRAEGTKFYKSDAELYHDFICETKDFIMYRELHFIFRYEDLTETVVQRVGAERTARLLPIAQFNVTLHSNITYAICLCFTMDGKVMSAERRLQIVDVYAPRIDINATSKSRTFKIGELNDNLTLTCPISGAPPPAYRWIFNENNTKHVRGSGTRNLTFSQVYFNLAGNYECFAQNVYGNNSFDFVVSVRAQDPDTTISGATIAWSAVGTILCFVVFCTAVVFAFKYFKARRQLRNLTPEEALEFLQGIPMAEASSSQAEGSELALHLPFTKCIEPKNLVVARDSILGKGQYGIVYQGILSAEAVAVKTFKRAVTYDEFRACLVEVKLMSFVGEHPNIIRFIGAEVANIEKRDILVVMELSPIGSLEKNLRLLKPSVQTNYVGASTSEYANIDERATLGTLFGFCEQIAFAMEHLESKRVIHGDLATRNVLVFSHGVVKVTDFGYSRQLYENSMYTPKKIRALPWRWASIELLRQMEFSTESDIWAFGVTVWEIFTFGNVPFASDKWSELFMESLENGLRLKKPCGLSDSQYSFLKECWNIDKSSRPRFSALKSFFKRESASIQLDVGVTQV